MSSNSAQIQRKRLLQYLREIGPISTLEARQKLDILHPAARVQWLREHGHNIVTEPVAEDGHHRVAKYFLLGANHV